MHTVSHQVLAERGVGGYRQYRIPALAATAAVTVAAFDGRHDFDDLPGPIDILLRRSLDSGRTWEPAQVVRSGEGFDGFGDPSLLVDPATGDIHLFYSATMHAGFFESSTGTDESDPDVQHVDVSTSSDDGLTWTHRRITAQLRATGNAHLDTGHAGAGGERIAGMFVTAGAGCAITAGPHTGRLVQPCVLRIGDRIDVACALSDDHGRTWRLGRPITHGRGGPDLNESSVCMLADGTVLLHSRGLGNRLAAVSADGGETFGPVTPVADLTDSGTNGSVLSLRGELNVAGEQPVAGEELYVSHTADPDLRRQAQISRSDDGGRTWRVVRLLEPGSAGYTQLAELPDGRIGVIYEANAYQEIRFEAYDRTELTGVGAGSEAAAVTTSGAGWSRTIAGGLEIDIVVRSIVPARPTEWTGSEPTHAIDLATFDDVLGTVFKEIGRVEGSVQVLRTRGALDANLGPIRPGINAGDLVTAHARVANTGPVPVAVAWAGDERTLEPGQAWIRRDLHHEVTSDDVARAVTTIDSGLSTPGASGSAQFEAVLDIPTARFESRTAADSAE